MKALRRVGAALLVIAVSFACVFATPASTFAQDIPVAPDSVPGGAPQPTAGDSGSPLKPGEVGQGAAQATTKINSLFASVITTAVDLSALLRSEADKFAGGLAVITLALAAARFAATKDAVAGWATLFEELGTLGIFAGFYVGYAGFAPKFFNWFQLLAQKLVPDMNSGMGIWSSASGKLFDAVAQALQATHWWDYPKVLFSTGPLIIAWAVLSLTTIVFLFYINVGQLQGAVGIVVGQIAFALGFSPFTRGYFKSWLDFMISAGMYTVVAAIMIRLVASSLTDAISAASGVGLSSPQGAVYVMDLSIFIFILSFEIPKIAGMFGGGANASGAALGKLTKLIPGV
ncbi:type IV secretion system protein [Paraburkholderia megapolitana]|uniref:type IV secretion system protein n=1 Tax=Paraburkholderia megapolitana TaxID=420953 RepID=UPI0038B9EFAA